MAIDEPIDSLKKHFEIEDAHSTPFVEPTAEFASLALSLFQNVPPGIKEILEWVKNHSAKQAAHRTKVMFDTCFDELKRLGVRVTELESEPLQDLIFDAVDKVSRTRSEERIKRVGMILAHGLAAFEPSEADEIEEMIGIAVELTDNDVMYLAKLIEKQGATVRAGGRIDRYQAHMLWEESDFAKQLNPEVESVFSKLAGYGLVWRLPSANNLNVQADIQNGYALLAKGVRFADMARSKS